MGWTPPTDELVEETTWTPPATDEIVSDLPAASESEISRRLGEGGPSEDYVYKMSQLEPDGELAAEVAFEDEQKRNTQKGDKPYSVSVTDASGATAGTSPNHSFNSGLTEITKKKFLNSEFYQNPATRDRFVENYFKALDKKGINTKSLRSEISNWETAGTVAEIGAAPVTMGYPALLQGGKAVGEGMEMIGEGAISDPSAGPRGVLKTAAGAGEAAIGAGMLASGPIAAGFKAAEKTPAGPAVELAMTWAHHAKDKIIEVYEKDGSEIPQSVKDAMNDGALLLELASFVGLHKAGSKAIGKGDLNIEKSVDEAVADFSKEFNTTAKIEAAAESIEHPEVFPIVQQKIELEQDMKNPELQDAESQDMLKVEHEKVTEELNAKISEKSTAASDHAELSAAHSTAVDAVKAKITELQAKADAARGEFSKKLFTDQKSELEGQLKELEKDGPDAEPDKPVEEVSLSPDQPVVEDSPIQPITEPDIKPAVEAETEMRPGQESAIDITGTEAEKMPEEFKEYTEQEIADAYDQRNQELAGMDERSAKEQILHDYLQKIKRSDFDHYGDPNLLKGDKKYSDRIRKRHFAKNAQPLDVQLKQLSEAYDVEITPQDAIDYILDREANPSKYPNKTVKRAVSYTQIPEDAARILENYSEFDLSTIAAVKEATPFPLSEAQADAVIKYLKAKQNEVSKAKNADSVTNKSRKQSDAAGKESAGVGEKPTLAERIDEQNTLKGLDRAARGLSNIADKIGAKKNLLPEDKTALIDDLKDVAIGIAEHTGKKGAELLQAVIDFIKQAQSKFPEKELNAITEEDLRGIAKEFMPGEEGVKKTVVTHRAYEGEVREEVKKHLEDIGLTREKISQKERSDSAESFINDVGEHTALDAVKSGDIRGAAASSVIAKLIKRNDDQIGLLDATNVTELNRLAKEQAELVELLGQEAYFGGEFNSQLAYEYENSDIGYNLQKKIREYKDVNAGEITPEVEKKFAEYDAQIKDLNRKIADAEKKASEAEAAKVEVEKTKLRPKIYGKARIAKGLDDLAAAIGAKASVIGSERPRVIEALEDIGRGLIEEGLATAENVAAKVKEYVEKRFKGKINFEDFSKELDYDKIVRESADAEARRTEMAKDRVRKRIDELKGKIDSGDLSKKIRKPIIEDTELIGLKAEKLRIQELFDREIYKAELNNRTKNQKIKDSLWDAWGLTRVLSATGEFSFMGIQGLTLTMRNLVRNPAVVADAFKNSLRFFGSEKKTEQWIAKIKTQSWYPELKESKLSLTEPHAKLTAREELFYSDWANMIWNTIGKPVKMFKGETAFEKWKNASPFKAFERAAIGYLDTLRVARWLDGKRMLEMQGIDYRANPEAYKQMADVINTLTGRASIKFGGKIENAELLTKIFFSPRNWASAIKTSTPYGLYHFGKMRAGAKGFKPTVAQKIALSDLSIQIGITTSMVALAYAYFKDDGNPETGVETDPRSSNFGKIALGNNVYVDPWGGKIQQIVFTSRIIGEAMHDALGDKVSKGGMKTKKGEIVPLGTKFKAETMGGTAAQMAINKLAPSAALLASYASTEERNGETFDKYGQPFELSDEIKERLYPIYLGTILDLAKDGVDPLEGFLLFYAFFGGGVQKYGEKVPKKTASPEYIQ